MIQRLIRGRALYVSLGLLLFFLYTRAAPLKLPEPHQTPQRPVISASPDGVSTHHWAEWMPKDLDNATIRRVALEEPWVGLLLLVAMGVAGVMALAGLLLTLRGVSTGGLRRIRQDPTRRLPPWSFQDLGRVVLLTLMVASLLPFVRLAVAAQRPDWELDTHAWIAGSMLFLDFFVVLTILALADGKGRSVWQTLGLSLHGGLGAARTGLRGYITMFPWFFVMLYLVTTISRWLGWEPPAEPIHELIFREHRPGMLAVTVAFACLFGPLAEELLFRGVFFAALRQRMSRWPAMLASGAVFALVHTNLIGFLPIMALGCLLAYLYERTGSLFSPLAVHVLHNTLLMSVALMFHHIASVA